MKGDIRCFEGDLWRHDPQHDDPELETRVGKCPECDGIGCAEIDRRVAKAKDVSRVPPAAGQSPGSSVCSKEGLADV